MNFDINKIPFSRYGSYLSFSVIDENYKKGYAKKGLYLRTIHGAPRTKEIFLFEPLKDESILKYRTEATPESLKIITGEGYVEICMAEADVIRIKGVGIGLKISSRDTDGFNNVIAIDENKWIINLFNLFIKFKMKKIRGDIVVDAPWNGLKCDYINIFARPDNAKRVFEFELTEMDGPSGKPSKHGSFDEYKALVSMEFESFIGGMRKKEEIFGELVRLAGYVNWSSVVLPSGLFRRPAMLMSKNWMTNVWSWDHCFNCIALSGVHPKLAWDQLMVMFDNQKEDGSLPDSVNDCYTINNFFKPPIHGWTILKLIEKNYYFTREKLAEIYEPLCRWTNWWFDYMDDDNDGIPSYNHGNDSGWDNCTVFVDRPPTETPDLTAFLVLQTEALAYIAKMLDKEDEAAFWEEKSADVLNKMIDHFIKDDRLVALTSKTHKIINSESLLLYVPIVLGKRLPGNILKNLVEGIKNDGFLTDYGLATESIKSDSYQSDGYWRGPIWAPSTFLIIDGLKASGQEKLAGEITDKFIKLIESGGFAENFDALTGEGLRDKAYTWTSSVFLSLIENKNIQ